MDKEITLPVEIELNRRTREDGEELKHYCVIGLSPVVYEPTCEYCGKTYKDPYTFTCRRCGGIVTLLRKGVITSKLLEGCNSVQIGGKIEMILYDKK
jgi:hypothetical protein